MSPARLLRLLGPSLRTLLAHRTRSALALAGVAIGVAAVQVVTAVAAGAQAQLLGGMGSESTPVVVVRPALAKRSAARRQVQGRVSTLTTEDAQALGELAQVQALAPSLEGPVRLRSEAATTRAQVLGTVPGFLEVRGFGLARGVFFSAPHDVRAERVVVLGARVSQALFPDGEPLGATVRLGAVPFEVIGVLAAQGVTADGADVDTQVYVPLRTAMRRVFNARALGAVFLRVRGEPTAETEEAVRRVLRERHRLDERERADDFVVQNPLRALGAKRRVAQLVTWFSAGLAALSLLVGGAGILALMLLSVRERTPEVGLRRAVGARPRDILVQFLAEAAALSLGGGVAGAVLGVGAAWLVSAATGWSARVPGWALLAGVATSAVLGLAFGVWPALRAARLSPLEALARE